MSSFKLQSRSSLATASARLRLSPQLLIRIFQAQCQPIIHNSKFPYLSQVANQVLVRIRLVSSLRLILPSRGRRTSYMASIKAPHNLLSSKDRYSSSLRLRCAHPTRLSLRICPRPLWRIDAVSRWSRSIYVAIRLYSELLRSRTYLIHHQVKDSKNREFNQACFWQIWKMVVPAKA